MHPKITKTSTQTLDLLFNLYLLGRKMKQLAKRHSPQAQDAMLRIGVLKLLHKSPCTVSEIAEAFSTGLSATSEKLKELKSQGYIEQVGGADGRQISCQITKKGVSQLQYDQVKVIHACEHIQGMATPSEIAVIQKFLDKILATNL